MTAAPFMQLYVGDFLADTTHLTQSEFGAYMLLLMAMWRAGGSLPADDAKLARFSRSTAPQWARMKATLMEFFTVEEGRITQGRLAAELEKYRVVVAKKSEAGKKSAEAKALKNNDTPPTPVGQAFNQPEPEPEPTVLEDKPLTLFRTPRSNGFDGFWAAYPRKTGKGEARKAYERALAKLKDPGAQTVILAALHGIKPTWATLEARFIPHPATWLNGERWDDEPDPIATGPPVHWRDRQAAEDEAMRRGGEASIWITPENDPRRNPPSKIHAGGSGPALPAPDEDGRGDGPVALRLVR